MKQLLHLGAAIIFAATTLHAQTLSITAPGYSGTKLFDSTAGYTVSGLAADSSGNVFYIESDSTNYTGNGILYKRSALDGYTAAMPLYNLGPGAFGSFVTVSGGKVFFGDGFNIRSINPDGTGVDQLGTVPNNYDAAFLDGQIYLSNNIELSFSNPPKNRVTRYDLTAETNGDGGLMLSGATSILKADNDYSGPVEFALSDLLYGASGAYFVSGMPAVTGIYRYANGTFGTSELALDNPHLLANPSASSALAYGGGNRLWQDSFSDGLNLYNLDDGSALSVGTASGSLGQLDYVNGTLFVNVSSSSFDRSTIYIVVPEPSSALLLLTGLVVFVRRRRKNLCTVRL